MQILENTPLKNFSTFGIGGEARYFVLLKDLEELAQVVTFAKEKNLPIFFFGGGSNILFPDEGLDAVVIRMQCNKIEYDDKINTITVEAGTMWPILHRFCKTHNLYGLEAFSGLPGTLGGALFGNAGAHKLEMKDVTTKAEIFDLNTQQFKNIPASEIEFSYRHSSFKKNPNQIITKVTLKVSTDPNDNTGDPQEFADFRKLNQPQGLTTGSFFKNPPQNFAGKLIEEAGLKGYRINNITTSDKHANFFINLGDATAKDVLSLKEHVVATVKEKTGIELEPEVQVITTDRLIHLPQS